MNKKIIQIKIINWLKKKKVKIKNTNANFVYSGLIDSMDAVNLIIFIENEFNFKFKKKDFLKKDFYTIKRLIEIVDKNV